MILAEVRAERPRFAVCAYCERLTPVDTHGTLATHDSLPPLRMVCRNSGTRLTKDGP